MYFFHDVLQNVLYFLVSAAITVVNKPEKRREEGMGGRTGSAFLQERGLKGIWRVRPLESKDRAHDKHMSEATNRDQYAWPSEADGFIQQGL